MAAQTALEVRARIPPVVLLLLPLPTLRLGYHSSVSEDSLWLCECSDWGNVAMFSTQDLDGHGVPG